MEPFDSARREKQGAFFGSAAAATALG